MVPTEISKLPRKSKKNPLEKDLIVLKFRNDILRNPQQGVQGNRMIRTSGKTID